MGNQLFKVCVSKNGKGNARNKLKIKKIGGRLCPIFNIFVFFRSFSFFKLVESWTTPEKQFFPFSSLEKQTVTTGGGHKMLPWAPGANGPQGSPWVPHAFPMAELMNFDSFLPTFSHKSTFLKIFNIFSEVPKDPWDQFFVTTRLCIKM